MTFTAHNVVLDDGTQTLPGAVPIAETGICQAALRDLELAFDYVADLDRKVAVADLGCLEGGYAAEFARAGYDVTGIEVRDDNFACCRAVERALGLRNLHFAQADVRGYLANVATIGARYDAVFCCGLLYHLDRPVEFLELLGRVTARLLILQTHYSARPQTENEGYAGHWYAEPPDNRWASHGNQRSFWLAKGELLRAVGAAGFDLVYEQHDYRHPAGGPYFDMFGAAEVDRCMLACVKL